MNELKTIEHERDYLPTDIEGTIYSADRLEKNNPANPMTIQRNLPFPPALLS
jgi:hypothetical protein